MIRLLQGLAGILLINLISRSYSTPVTMNFTATVTYPSCTVNAPGQLNLSAYSADLAGTDAIADKQILTITLNCDANTAVPQLTPAVSITPQGISFANDSCLLGSTTALPVATPNQGIILGDMSADVSNLSFTNCIHFLDQSPSASSYYWDVGSLSGSVTSNTVNIAVAIAKKGNGQMAEASYSVPIDFDFTYH